MEEILARQRNAAKPLSGRGFVLGVAGMIVTLSLVQIVTNLLIAATGMGLLNVLYYLSWIVVIARFMHKTVAGCVYMLKPSTLVMQKTLGDSTTAVIEIPREAIVSIRPVFAGDRMKSAYRSVTVIDHTVSIPFRVKLAFALSLFSARLARKLAGGEIHRMIGYVVVYTEEEKRVAVVFKPDEEFCAALHRELPQVWCVDERSKENTRITMLGRALERAFPELYPFVDPLVEPEKARAAIAEVNRQKQQSQQKKQERNLLFEKKRKAAEKKKATKKDNNDEV